MAKILFTVFLMALGALITWQGNLLTLLWDRLLYPPWGLKSWQVNLIVGGLGGGLAALLMLAISSIVKRKVEAGTARELINGGIGALLGTLLGLVFYLILELIFSQSLTLQLIEGAVVLFMSFLGFRVGYRKENLLLEAFQGEKASFESSANETSPKLLDTSVIIDGRIGDLVKTGFIEGKIIIPQFVLDELHNIADSSDNLRRRKGRRGLDILGDLRRNPDIQVETSAKDYPEFEGVDRKLIQLAKELHAKILTTDYNLNKVAKVENTPVLNINELANAVKPRFIPGEELEVEVIDRGEEIGQGVGYLDDGTMVVVENGRRFIGKTIKVIVNSSLQTDAGKMLFVRPKVESKGRWEE